MCRCSDMPLTITSPDPLSPEMHRQDLARLAKTVDLFLQEQKRTNELLTHLISAVNRRSVWDS
jgi:hypothetical protein